MGLLKKGIKKLIETFPFMGWFLLVYPVSKLVKSICYHTRIYKLGGINVRGLHLGSGGLVIDGFLNIDGNPAAFCDVVGGVEKIHLQTGSVGSIYTSHVFEHIPRSRIPTVLAEWFRVLKPGGGLYICVPDVEILFRIYLDGLNAYDQEAAVRDRVDLSCGVVFGGQVNRFDFHYYGYSYKTLKLFLENAGFTSVERFDRAAMKEFPVIDASFASIDGVPVSLNLVALK